MATKKFDRIAIVLHDVLAKYQILGSAWDERVLLIENSFLAGWCKSSYKIHWIKNASSRRPAAREHMHWPEM